MKRLLFLSTYPPTHCGIGRYTASLLEAIQDRAASWPTRVIAEVDAAAPANEPGVCRTWSRRDDWVADVLKALDAEPGDIVHVQHEEAIFGQDGRMIALLSALRRKGAKTVVTLHSVYGGLSGWIPGRSWRVGPFHRALAEHAHRLIVHQRRGMEDRLLSQGVPASKISVIPHGSRLLESPDRLEARGKLGLDADSKIILFFGFIHPKKGLHVLVQAFDDVLRHLPEAKLLIVGSPRRRHALDGLYLRRLKKKMSSGMRRGAIDFRPVFVPDGDLPLYLAAADLVALPHRQSYGSASGVLHAALGAGRAVVCSRGLKFGEAIDSWAAEVPQAFPAPGRHEAWRESLTGILLDDTLRFRIETMSRQLGIQTSWAVVADRHLRIYGEL